MGREGQSGEKVLGLIKATWPLSQSFCELCVQDPLPGPGLSSLSYPILPCTHLQTLIS